MWTNAQETVGVMAAPAWALLSCHETENRLTLLRLRFLSLSLVKDKVGTEYI